MSDFKIVVITNGNFFARLALNRLVKECHDDIAGIVVVTGIKANKSRVRSLVEILQQTGVHYFLYKASTYIVFALAKLLFPKRIFFVPNLAKPYNVPVIYTQRVNEASIKEQIRLWNPTILASVSCPQRIGKEILAIPTGYAVNIHSSLLPAYAGIAPYLWVLANGEKMTGVTVHIMEEKFDTGAILSQKKVEISPGMSLFSLFVQTTTVGSDALYEAITGLENGTVEFKQQDQSKRSYFSWPTTEAVRKIGQNGHPLVKFSDYFEAINAVK